MDDDHICAACESLCEVEEVDVGGPEEWWGRKVHRAEYELKSTCCNSEAYTIDEWRSNGWNLPEGLFD